jgi:prolyl oligopeptidase
LQDASDRIKVFDLSVPSKHIKDLELPGIGTVIGTSGKYNQSEFFYKFTSFTDPGSSYRVDLSTFELETVAVTKLSA